MTRIVVPLDLRQPHRLRNPRNLVQLEQVVPQIRIIDDAPLIAFEVAVIDRIETHERREQSPISLGDARAGKISRPLKSLLELIERAEQRIERLIVRRLRGREPASINAIVDPRINQGVQRIDLAAQLARVEIDRSISPPRCSASE